MILTNVLHVPSLRLPLYSIRVHRRSLGCTFIADNKGDYLTFPEIVLDVDDSVDCLIQCSEASPMDRIHFYERSAGKVSAVSDNTRNRHKRRPVVGSSPSTVSSSPAGPVMGGCR